jgi:hypothetical protein
MDGGCVDTPYPYKTRQNRFKREKNSVLKMEKSMIEIKNINAVQSGSLLATCDVHIIPWCLTLHEVKIFEKGANRWLGMPSKEFTNNFGEKKYTELMTFDNDGIKNRFRSQIMGAVDKFLENNPDMKPEDVIKEDDDIPF